MKKFKDISEFEDLLKENLQGHSTPAPPDVWSSISTSTAQSAGALSQASSFLSSASNLLKVALFAGGIAAIGIVVYNENKPASATQQEEQVSPKTEQDLVNNEKQEIETQVDEIDEEPTKSKELQTATTKEIAKPKTNKTTDKPSFENIKEANSTDINTSETPVNDKVENSRIGERIASTIKSHFDISNTKPCIGEMVTLSQQTEAEWFVNGISVAKGTKKHSFVAKESGVIEVSNGSQTKSIDVGSLDASISYVKTAQGKYTCELQEGLIANWYINNTLIATNAPNVDLTIEEVGTHNVKATIVNHVCNTTVVESIKVAPVGEITFYTIFTPDGDGKNDMYKVDISGYDNFSIQIFDVSNNALVFMSQNPDYKWDGTINNEGAQCKQGTYIAKVSYKLKGESPEVKSIKLTLKR